MIAPVWITWLFTALVISLALFSAARLLVARRRRQFATADVDIVHALMGIAMAGMLMPRLSVLPGDLWLAMFSGGTAWFGWQAISRRSGHKGAEHGQYPVPHVVECLAMVYMLLAAAPLHGMSMPGMSATAQSGPRVVASNPVLPLLLCVFMLGSALWTIDKLTAGSANGAAARGQSAAAPRLASYSKVGMSLAMGYALLTML